MDSTFLKEKKSFHLASPSNSKSGTPVYYKQNSPLNPNITNSSFLNYSTLSQKVTGSLSKQSTMKGKFMLQPIQQEKVFIPYTEENNDLIRIKIENLKNYKDQPVYVYDELGLEKDRLEDQLKEGLIINGFSRWKDQNGENQWKACQIISYNDEKKLYKIQWLESDQIKEVTRLNLIVDSENFNESQHREQRAYNRREQKLFNDSLANLVNSSSKNMDLLMHKQTLQNIIKRTFDVLGESARIDYGDTAIFNIIEQYKFYVVRFQIGLNTVSNLHDYYMKYIPHAYYKLKKEVKKVVILDKTIEVISSPHKKDKKNSPKNQINSLSASLSQFNPSSPPLSPSVSSKSWRSRIIASSLDSPKKKNGDFYLTENPDTVKEDEEGDIINQESENNNKPKTPNSSVKDEVLKITHTHTIQYNIDTRYYDLKNYLLKNLFGASPIFPLGDINGVYPIIISLLDLIQSLQNYRIYSPFKTSLSQKFEDYNQFFNSIEGDFLKEIDKIETLIYKIEKTIDLLKKDLEIVAKLRIQKMIGNREQPPFDLYIKQYLQNLQNTCNLVLKSNLNITVNESFSDILDMWDSYYLTIPLPHTTPKLFNKLPFLIRQRKQQMLLKYNIPSPLSKIELVEQDDIEEKDYNVFKFDCQIIFDIYCEIIDRALEKNAMQTYLFKGNLALDPVPICKFQLVLTKYRKNPQIKYMFHYFMRCRDKIYGSQSSQIYTKKKIVIGEKTRPWRPKQKTEDEYQNQLQYVMHDVLRINSKDTLFYQDYQEKCKNKEVSYKKLGWFDTKHMRINIDPTLEQMEERWNKVIASPINKFQQIQKINGYIHNHGIEQIDEILSNFGLFNSHFNEFLTWNYYTIYSILIVFNQFDFYLFEKDYFDELLEIFYHSAQVQFMGQERQKLLQDKDFILRRLPDVFKVGFFEIDTTEIKQIIVKKIDLNIKKADDAINEKFFDLLTKTNETFKEISSFLSDDPNTIDKYIDLMTFLSQKDLKRKWQQCQIDLRTINLLYKIIEENYIEFDYGSGDSNDIFFIYMESQNWLNNLMILFQEAKGKLDSRKSHFQSILRDLRNNLLLKFENAKEQVIQFKTFSSLKNCEMILRKSKDIEENLKQIIQEGDAVNKKESILNYPLSDFRIFQVFLNQFDSNLLFWEFAEKWYRSAESWLCYPFEKLLNGQNGNIQETLRLEILDACREGSSLMQKLEKQLEIEKDEDEDYQKRFLENISTIESEIDDFNQYLPIIMMLLNKSFKESYWTQLLNEIYGKESRIKPHELTIEILKRDSILRYKKYIYILFNNSQQELKLFEEIEKIENLIMECLPKTQTSKNPEYPYHYIGNVSQLKSKLEELNFNIISLISQFDTNERLKLIQKYVEELKTMFENMIAVQEEIMILCPFFQILTDFIPDTKYIRTKFRNMNLKIKEDFKKKTLLSKNFVQKQIDPKEFIKLSQLKKDTDALLNSTMQLKKEVSNYIKGVRESNSRFYQLSDQSIIKMMSSNFNTIELKQFIIETFSGVQDILFGMQDENYFVVDYITNYQNEFIYPLEQIKVTRIPKLQGGASCCTSNNGQLPISVLVTKIEECLLGRVKKNIFQNILAVSSTNYDYQNIWKLYQNKQVYFQTLFVMIDICFYNDLTLLIHHQAYNKESEINKEKPIQIKQAINPRVSTFKQDMSSLKARNSFNKSNLHRPSILGSQGFNFKRDSRQINMNFKEMNPQMKLNQMLKHMIEEQQKFFDFIKLKSRAFSSKSNILLVNQIILQGMAQREILQQLINEKIQDINSFEYLALPKFTLNCQSKESLELFKSSIQNEYDILNEGFEKLLENQNIPQISSLSPFFNSLKNDKNTTISMICMNYSVIDILLQSLLISFFLQQQNQIDYSYELTPEIKYFILCQSTQRQYCQIIQCLSTLKGCMILSNEPNNKSDTIKQLSMLLAKPLLLKNYTSNTPCENITRQLVGAAQGGYWMNIQNLDVTDLNIISQIASIFNEIRMGILEQKETVDIQNYTIKINPNFSLFTSYFNRQFFNNNRKDIIKFTQIPQSFLSQFRVVNFAQINLPFISQCYLALIGQQTKYLILNDQKYFLLIRIKETIQFQSQFTYFISTLCQNFFVNLGKDESISSQENELYSKLMNQSSYIQIFQTCIEFQRQKLEVDDFIQPLDAFKASMLQYFKYLISIIIKFRNLLNVNQTQIFNYVYDCFFPSQQKSLIAQQLVDNPNNTDFFREYFQINKLELHEDFIVHANGLINLVNQKKNIIIAGKSGYGKNTLVKIASFVYSRMNEKDFLVNNIPVECLDQSFLIGSFNAEKEFKEGLLTRLYDTINCIPDELIEERKNILISNEDICSSFSKKRIIDNHSNKIVNLSKKQRYISKQDWFIFDCGQTQYCEKIRLAELLLDSIDDNLLYLPNGMTQKISQENQNIFLFDNLNNISPRVISNFSIFILHKELFSVKEEFNSWLNKKCHQQPKVQNYIPYIKCVFEHILLRCLDWIEDHKQKNELFLFQTSKKQRFLNFLNIFEILLNEVRKREISLGLFEYSELSVKERKMTPDPILLRKVSLIEKELSQFQKFNSSIFSNITCERTLFQIESIFISSILYGMCTCLNEQGKNQFSHQINQFIKEYCGREFKGQFDKLGFAFDLLLKMENAEKENQFFSYFEYCFSQIDCKWVEWSSIALTDSLDEISNDYSQNVLNPRELVRLNPLAADIEEISNYIDNKTDYKMIQFCNFTYHETSSTKIQNYFIDLSLSYNKKILFCSQRSQGKTTLLKKLINRLFKKNSNSVLHLSASSPISDLNLFQNMIEQKLRPKFTQTIAQQHQNAQSNNTTQLNNTNAFIFIDDLNFAQTSSENNDILLQLKSLITLKGWYSLETQKFKRFKQFAMLSALSIDSNNQINFLDQNLCQVPQKIISNSLILFLDSISQIDIVTIFRKHVGSLFTNEIDFTRNDRIIMECWTSFSLLIFDLQSLLTKLRKTYQTNIGISQGFHIIKYFNNFEFMDSGEVKLEDFLQGFLFLFNNILCDNFTSNSLPHNNFKCKLSQLYKSKNKDITSESTLEENNEGQQPSPFDLDDSLTASSTGSVQDSFRIDEDEEKMMQESQISLKLSTQRDSNFLSSASVEANRQFRLSKNLTEQRKQILNSLVQYGVTHQSRKNSRLVYSRQQSKDKEMNESQFGLSRNSFDSNYLNVDQNYSQVGFGDDSPQKRSFMSLDQDKGANKLNSDEKEEQNFNQFMKYKRNYLNIPNLLIRNILGQILGKHFSEEQLDLNFQNRNSIQFVSRKLLESYENDGTKKKELTENAQKQIENIKTKENEKNQMNPRKSIFATQNNIQQPISIMISANLNINNNDSTKKNSLYNMLTPQRSNQFSIRSSINSSNGIGESVLSLPVIQSDKKTLQSLTEASISSDSSLDVEGESFVMITNEIRIKLKNIYFASLIEFYYCQFSQNINEEQENQLLETQNEIYISTSLFALTSISTKYFCDLMAKIQYFLEIPDINIIFESPLPQLQTQFFIQYACQLQDSFKTSIQITDLPRDSINLRNNLIELLSLHFSNAIKSLLQTEGKKSVVIIELPQNNGININRADYFNKIAEYILDYLVNMIQSSEFYCLIDRKILAEMHSIVKKRQIFAMESFTHSQICAYIFNEIKMNLKVVLISYQQGSQIFLPFFDRFEGLLSDFCRVQLPKSFTIHDENDKSQLLYQSLFEFYSQKKIKIINTTQKDLNTSFDKQQIPVQIKVVEEKIQNKPEKSQIGVLLSDQILKESQRFLELNDLINKYEITKNQGLSFIQSSQNMQCMIFALMNGITQILNAKEQQICQSGLYSELSQLIQKNESSIQQNSTMLGVKINQIEKQFQMLLEQRTKDKNILQENKNILSMKQQEKANLMTDFTNFSEILDSKVIKQRIRTCLIFIQPILPAQYKKDIEILLLKKSQAYLYILALFLDVDFYFSKYYEEESKIISAQMITELKNKVLNSKEMGVLFDKIQDLIKKDNENQQKEYVTSIMDKYDYDKTELIEEAIAQKTSGTQIPANNQKGYQDYSLSLLHLMLLLNSIYELQKVEIEYKPKIQILREKIQQIQYRINSLSEEIRQTEKQVAQGVEFEKLKIKEQNQAIQELNQFNQEINKIHEFFETINNQVLKSYLITQNYLDTDPELRNKQILGIVNYIVFISQYPANIRQKCLDYLYYDNWIIYQYLTKYLTTTLRGNLFYSKCYAQKIHMSNALITQLAILETFIFGSENLPAVTVLDNSQIILNYIEQIKGVNIQKEFYTIDTIQPDGMKGMINSIQAGNLLVLVDPNQDLINLIKPLIEYKFFSSFEKASYQNFYNVKKESAQQISGTKILTQQQQQQQQQQKNSIQFCNENIVIHPNFQIIIIITHNQSRIESEICDKMVCINCCQEGENDWISHIKDSLLNQFEFEAKLGLIQNHQKKIQERQKSIENSYAGIKSILQRFKIQQSDTLQEALNYNLHQYIFSLNQFMSRPNPEEINNINFYKHLKFQKNSFNINNLFKSKKKKSYPKDIYQSRSKYISYTNISAINDFETLFKSVFIGKMQVQVQGLNDNCYIIDGLEQLAYDYNHTSGYFYIIKQVLHKLQPSFGQHYGFSDNNFMQIIELSCSLYQKVSNEPKPKKNLPQFSQSVAFFMQQIITQSLRDDHRVAFSLYFGMIMSKILYKSNQLHWNQLLNGDYHELQEEEYLLSNKDIQQWCDFMDLSRTIFKLPTLNFYQVEQRFKNISLQNLRYSSQQSSLKKENIRKQLQNKRKQSIIGCTQKILQIKQQQISIFDTGLAPLASKRNSEDEQSEENQSRTSFTNRNSLGQIGQEIQKDQQSSLQITENSAREFGSNKDQSNEEINNSPIDIHSDVDNNLEGIQLQEQSFSQSKRQSIESRLSQQNDLGGFRSKVLQNEMEEMSDEEKDASKSSNSDQGSNSSNESSGSEGDSDEHEDYQNQSQRSSYQNPAFESQKSNLVRVSLTNKTSIGVERKSIFSSNLTPHSLSSKKSKQNNTQKPIKVAKPIRNEAEQKHTFEKSVDSFPFNIGTLINIETKISYGQEVANQKKQGNLSSSISDDQKIALLDKVFANFLKQQTNKSSNHLKSSIYIDQKDLKNITQFSTFKFSKGVQAAKEQQGSKFNVVVNQIVQNNIEKPNVPENQETVLPINMIQSLMNLSNIFDKNNNLQAVINRILQDQTKIANDFISKQSAANKHYVKLFKTPRMGEFLTVTPFDFLLIMKYLKPHELESYAKDFLNQVFFDKFSLTSNNNLDHILKLQLGQNNPFLIITDSKSKRQFYSELEKSKIRIRKSQFSQISNNISIHRILLSNLDFSSQYLQIKSFFSKGEWVYLENVQYLNSQNILMLTRLIMEVKHKNAKLNESSTLMRIFIQIETKFDSYEPFEYSNCDCSKEMYLLMKHSNKIYLLEEKSIQESMTTLYADKIFQFISVLEDLVHTNQAKINVMGCTFLDPLRTTQLLKYSFENPQTSQILISLNKSKEYMHKEFILKQQNNNYQSNNLHSLVLPSKNSTNTQLIKILNQGYIKNKYNLLFVFATMIQRQKYCQFQGQYYEPEKLNYIDSQEINEHVEDMLRTTQRYPQNPYIFFAKYVKQFFPQRNLYNTTCFLGQTIQSFLNVFVNSQFEKQIKYTFDGIDYLMHSTELEEELKICIEEQICIQVNSLPSQDASQIMGLSDNNIIQMQQLQSEKLLQLFIKQDDFHNKNTQEANKACKQLFKKMTKSSKPKQSNFSLSVNRNYENLIKLESDQLKKLQDEEDRILELIFVMRKLIKDKIIDAKLLELSEPLKEGKPQTVNLNQQQTSQTQLYIRRGGIQYDHKSESQKNISRLSIQKLQSKQSVIEQFTEDLKIEPIDDDRRTVFSRIKDYLPHNIEKRKQRESNSDASKDVLKTFKNMHNEKKQKKNLDIQIILYTEEEKQQQDYIGFFMNKNTPIKLFFMNELNSMNELIQQILNDFNLIEGYIRRSIDFAPLYKERIKRIYHQIKENKVPTDWIRKGFLNFNLDITSYFKQLIFKADHLSKVIKERNMKLFPSLPFFQIFDPFGLILNLLFQYSKKNKIPMNQLKIKVNKVKQPPSEAQDLTNNGICISGMYIQNGDLNQENNYLVNENQYSYLSQMPYLQFQIGIRNKPDIVLDFDPYVAFEFYDQVHEDIEENYIQQFFSPPQIDYDNLLKKFIIKDEYTSGKRESTQINMNLLNDKKPSVVHTSISFLDGLLHFVKIPIVNPLAIELQKEMNLKFFFFFKSYFSEDHWIKKSTEIYFSKHY